MKKKIILLAGEKSHDPGFHEYEKDLTLLETCLEQSSLRDQLACELHTNGWPERVETLETADTIVLFSDGSDYEEKRHPFLIGDRMEVIGRQMRRGCGLVLEHYAVFLPSRFQDSILEWCGGYFDYQTGGPPRGWYSKMKTDRTTPELAAPSHSILNGVAPFEINEEYYYNIHFKEHDSRLTPLLRTSIKDEEDEYTVAWALERDNGGRSFATTMGHYHSNMAVDGFRSMLANGIAWTAGLNVPSGGLG
ncbi:MAG: ThuA domain-containing protein [Terrimicrobiaceae bacterium]|nr:ThuA domain-containing protein [Terrimicrobiaceae bacterium]